jgi:hypothetical protein
MQPRPPGGARLEHGEGEDIETFLAALDHPRKREILALRQIILAADPAVREGIKWKVPSFRTTEYFATLHLRAPDRVQVILHFGAKKRDGFAPRSGIADPTGLLEWLGPDRAAASFRDLAGVEAKRPAFESLIREWIRFV